MKRWTRTIFAAVLGLSLGCASCGLIPEEETFPAAPFFVEELPGEYQTAVCLTGDVVLSTSLDLRTVPKQKENLSFPVTGERYDAFFVSTGENVTEGQILGQLDIKMYEDQLRSLEIQKEENGLTRKQNEENRALQEKRARIAYADSYADRQKALTQIANQFDESSKRIDDADTILDMRIENCKAEITKRQLIAPFDGVITYVANFTPEDVSSSGRRMMTIADSSTTLFRSSTVYWQYFKEGLTIPIAVDESEYIGTVRTEESLGLAPTRHVEGSSGYIYVELKSPAFDVTDGKTIKIDVELERRDGCLTVPSTAVSKINDKTVVYYPDENGVKRFREVETGLVGRSLTEIKSGLSEGDTVIID